MHIGALDDAHADRLAGAVDEVEDAVRHARVADALGQFLIREGVHDAGLTTQVQPLARQGATFHEVSMKGRFHGVMSPATPAGRWTV